MEITWESARDLLLRRMEDWHCYQGDLKRFEERVERVLKRYPPDAEASRSYRAAVSDQTVLAEAISNAMAALPVLPADLDLPYAELIYPAPGTPRANTLVYRSGDRVLKLALDESAEQRLRREEAVLSVLGPLGGYACFPTAIKCGRVRDRRLAPRDLLCLAEDYVPGVPIDAYAEKRKISGCALGEREYEDLLDQLLVELAIVHRNGLIHRDVHPGNVLVDDLGEVRLIDFGCVITLSEGADARECVISRGFEPPEAHEGGPYTPASDTYAACAAIAQLAYGTTDGVELPATRLARRLLRGMQRDPESRFS